MTEAGKGHAVETSRRLSESMLWTLQRRFYDGHGVEAWSSGTIPHYITANTFIAWSYARVIRGFITDLARAGRLDHNKPVYVVEYGAGPGRFGFLCLRELLALVHRRFPDLRVIYVLTDFTPANLAFWRAHPRLQPFFEEGSLDLARFDVENDGRIVTERGGVVLGPETVNNPLVVIANYVLDTLGQDLFRLYSGMLLDCPVSLWSDREVAPAPDDPELLTGLKLVTEPRTLETEPYPDHPAWNHILETYRDTMGDATIGFPVGALRCIDHLRSLSRDAFLLLAADKSHTVLADMLWNPEPQLVLHGASFSLTANLDAVSRYVEHGGGFAMNTSPRETSLQISAFGQADGVSMTETRLEFDEAIDGFGPLDFFTISDKTLFIGPTAPGGGEGETAEPPPSLLTLRQWVDYLRLGHHDFFRLYVHADSVYSLVDSAPEGLRNEFREALALVWDRFYAIGDTMDVPFMIGRFLFRLGECREAIGFYQESLRDFGIDSMTLFNIGMCHYRLGEHEEAQACLRESLALNPENPFTAHWLPVLTAAPQENVQSSPPPESPQENVQEM